MRVLRPSRPALTVGAVAMVTALVFLAAGTASAHDRSAIDQTRNAQIDAIIHNRSTGQLTRREAEALLAEQNRIAAAERRARADGHLSGREYRAIREAQQDAGHHIAEDSTNARVNWWRRWTWRHGL